MHTLYLEYAQDRHSTGFLGLAILVNVELLNGFVGSVLEEN